MSQRFGPAVEDFLDKLEDGKVKAFSHDFEVADADKQSVTIEDGPERTFRFTFYRDGSIGPYLVERI